MTRPIDVICSFCGANPGDPCTTSAGKEFRRVGIPTLRTHAARNKAAEEAIESVVVDGLDHPPQVVPYVRFDAYAKLPKKLKYRVRAKEYVWCDAHGGVHPSQRDYYEENRVYCVPSNWRRVYIETDDKKETF